jgi:hypothetical protein
MQRLYILLICQICCNHLYPIGETSLLNGANFYKDGRSIALGGGINAIEKSDASGMSMNYLRPYNLNELSTRSIKGKYTTKWMGFDGQWAQSGDEIFMENYINFGASRQLSKAFELGIKGGYYHYATINDIKGSALLSEFYCYYNPFEKMQVCIYLFNPTRSKVRQSGALIPLNQSFHFGSTFFPVKSTALLIEFEKQQQQDLIFHIGMESSAWETFIIRAGISTQPLMPSWGIGGKIYHIKYAIGWNMHPALGISSCFSLQYNW